MPKPSKLTIYVLVSVAIAAAVSYKTFSQPHVSFSLGFTRLTNSKLNNAILFNCIFSIVLVTVNTLIKFFFGEMREIERYVILFKNRISKLVRILFNGRSKKCYPLLLS